jgi:hypothetical protein
MLPLVASAGMFFVIDAGHVQALCEWEPPEGPAMGTVRYSYHPCCQAHRYAEIARPITAKESQEL